MALLWENEAVLKYLLENRLRILNWESLIRSFFFVLGNQSTKRDFPTVLQSLLQNWDLELRSSDRSSSIILCSPHASPQRCCLYIDTFLQCLKYSVFYIAKQNTFLQRNFIITKIWLWRCFGFCFPRSH